MRGGDVAPLARRSVDVVELEVDGAREADARDVGPVEEGVGCECEEEEDQRG